VEAKVVSESSLPEAIRSRSIVYTFNDVSVCRRECVPDTQDDRGNAAVKAVTRAGGRGRGLDRSKRAVTGTPEMPRRLR